MPPAKLLVRSAHDWDLRKWPITITVSPLLFQDYYKCPAELYKTILPKMHFWINITHLLNLACADDTGIHTKWREVYLITTFAEYGTQREHRQQVTWFLLGLAPLWGWYSAGAQATGHVAPSRPGSLCKGGGDSLQHRHQPTLIDKCVGSFKSPDRTSRD